MSASSAAYHALAEENAELRTRMSGLHQQVASLQAQLSQVQAEREKLTSANLELQQSANSERQQRAAAESSRKEFEQRWRQAQDQLNQRDSLVREWRNKCTVNCHAFDECVSLPAAHPNSPRFLLAPEIGGDGGRAAAQRQPT
jgi:chromosome segregation ATPase